MSNINITSFLNLIKSRFEREIYFKSGLRYMHQNAFIFIARPSNYYIDNILFFQSDSNETEAFEIEYNGEIVSLDIVPGNSAIPFLNLFENNIYYGQNMTSLKLVYKGLNNFTFQMNGVFKIIIE